MSESTDPGDTTGPDLLEADSSVKPRLTPRRRSKRPRRSVEALDFIAAVRRMLRAAAVRVADSDEYELAALLQLRSELDDAISVAVRGQKTRRSWAYIAAVTGTTRQAAQQKWGSPNA